MALSTLTLSKVHASIAAATTTYDTLLKQLIKGATAAVRNHVKQNIGEVIDTITLANPTVCTCLNHGLTTGDTIVIAGSDSTPTINGSRVVTVLTADTFTVPVNVTTAGTIAYFSQAITEFYAGNNTPRLPLLQLPVQSIGSVYEDAGAYYGEASGAFASTTLLTAGTQYCLLRDNGSATEKSTSGLLLRIGSRWPAAQETLQGMLVGGKVAGLGNIKVTYTPGYEIVPADIILATNQVVARLMQSAAMGGGLASESLDYFSYSRMSAAEENLAIDGVRKLLSAYTQWVI